MGDEPTYPISLKIVKCLKGKHRTCLPLSWVIIQLQGVLVILIVGREWSAKIFSLCFPYEIATRKSMLHWELGLCEQSKKNKV